MKTVCMCDQIAEGHGVGLPQLREVDRRRQYHDDITCVVVYFGAWSEDKLARSSTIAALRRPALTS